MNDPVVRLHVLSAGSMTSSLSGFLEGEPGDITYPVPIYAIEHHQGLVVVDAGLHPDLAQSTDRLRKLAPMFTPHLPADGSGTAGPALTAAGFDPSQVEHVILTHLHFDHTGGLLEIPNARVIVQAKEWAELKDERQVRQGSYNPDDVDLGHQRVELDGDHDLFGDGSVMCLLTDGHTVGHQSIRVQTETGPYIICGDCCYLRRTLTDEHLPSYSQDRDRQLTSIRRLADEQRAGSRLIFGHDPEQFEAIKSEGLHAGV